MLIMIYMMRPNPTKGHRGIGFYVAENYAFEDYKEAT